MFAPDNFVYLFMTGFCVIFGFYLIFERRSSAACLASAEGGSDLQRRIDSVLEARSAIDASSDKVKYVAGGIWLALAPLVALRILSPALAYAFGVFGLAGCYAYSYLRMRAARRRRAAIMTPRRLGAPVPAYWYALAVLSTLSATPALADPSLRASAIVLVISTFATIGLAVLTAGAPATLFGDDLQVEQLVDDRLRFSRATQVLMLAIVQPFVYCAWSSTTLSMIVPMLVFFAYAFWVIRRRLTPVRDKDLNQDLTVIASLP
jgi:hypothetical protein